MRHLVIVAFIIATGCGDGSTPTAPPSPAVSSARPTPEPSPEADEATPAPEHGGTVIVTGAHVVELLGHADGRVEAWVRARSGETPDFHDVQLTARVTTSEGTQRPVVLTWNPAAEHYLGVLHDAHPIPAPITVRLGYRSATALGHANTLVVTAPAPPARVARAGGGSAVREPPPPALEVRPATRTLAPAPRPLRPSGETPQGARSDAPPEPGSDTPPEAGADTPAAEGSPESGSGAPTEDPPADRTRRRRIVVDRRARATGTPRARPRARGSSPATVRRRR